MENYQKQADAAKAEGYVCIVGALIVNDNNEIFVQKRSADRSLFPNCWDIVGGHVEEGETLEEATSRETAEETGWSVEKLGKLVDIRDWETSEGQKHKEFIFLVNIDGDLEKPVLEEGKVSEGRWIAPSDVEVLLENRDPGDTHIYDIVNSGFETMKTKR